MVSNRDCSICYGSSNLKLCDCSNITSNNVVQCNTYVCNGYNSNDLKKSIEARIQNQVAVSQSQMNSIRSSFYIREYSKNSKLISSTIWGNPNNLRNQSDRSKVHFPGNYNIPTHGNSTKSSITSLRPGSMCPGGKGVDVKHGSYARYLGKIKANNISNEKMGPYDNSQNDVNDSESRLIQLNSGNGARKRKVVNNKLFRFSIINTNNCCQ